jgi:hypothetical protein
MTGIGLGGRFQDRLNPQSLFRSIRGNGLLNFKIAEAHLAAQDPASLLV